MTTRRSKRRAPRDEIVWYALRVEGWNFDYHFGHVVYRHDPRNYREFSTMEITGTPIRPVGLKADKAFLTVSTGATLDELNQQRDVTTHLIGLINLIDGTLRGHLSIPSDAFQPLLQLLIAGQLGYAVLRGSKLRYRSAHIVDCQFCRTLDEIEDLPED